MPLPGLKTDDTPGTGQLSTACNAYTKQQFLINEVLVVYKNLAF
jgi:hypothetical protein